VSRPLTQNPPFHSALATPLILDLAQIELLDAHYRPFPLRLPVFFFFFAQLHSKAADMEYKFAMPYRFAPEIPFRSRQ